MECLCVVCVVCVWVCGGRSEQNLIGCLRRVETSEAGLTSLSLSEEDEEEEEDVDCCVKGRQIGLSCGDTLNRFTHTLH